LAPFFCSLFPLTEDVPLACRNMHVYQQLAESNARRAMRCEMLRRHVSLPGNLHQRTGADSFAFAIGLNGGCEMLHPSSSDTRIIIIPIISCIQRMHVIRNKKQQAATCHELLTSSNS
ncbi:hypothetical protein TRV_06174, partial [Trichophyton verrucosum HKI 0517]